MDDARRGEREHEGVAGERAEPVLSGTEALPPTVSNRTSIALIAFVVIAIGILVAGIVVFVASGGADDEFSSASIAPFVTGDVAVAASTTAPSTAATTAPTTPPTTAATSAPSTAPTPTTDPTRFSLPEPGAETWIVTSDFIPEMTLRLASTAADIRVFDGVADGRRCVGVVGPGDAVTTWCGAENAARSFLADRELGPVVIDLGAEVGNVTIQPQSAGWTLGSNGCSAPMATILTGVDPGALPITGIICRRNEAFIGIGSALFGPGIAPDGGGILAIGGDGGWTVLDFGTSVDCAGQPAGAERCELYGVESDLFEALLPLPSVVVLGESSVDIVAVTDKTAEVESWIGDTTDPEEVEAIIVGQLVDPVAEVPAITRVDTDVQSGRYRLVVVEIPQLDDSIATETWAIWIGSSDQTRGVTAFSWATCARGVTDDGLCV